MTSLIIYFLIAVVVSFLCSLMEAVLLSVSQAYIAVVVRRGHRYARLLRDLKHNINRPLAAILTLNTVANTVGAAGVGAQAARLWGTGWVPVASAVLTLTILIFSEIIPKTLGAVHARRLARPAAYGISGMVKLLWPFVAFFEALGRWISPKGKQVRFSREEMIAAAELGQSEGALLTQEVRIIHNLLGLHRMRVKDILTPRSVMTAWQKDRTVEEVVTTTGPIRFSRIPLYAENLDDITGLVYRAQVLDAYTHGRKHLKLAALAQPVHFVPETKTVASTLDEFIQRREHMFIVVDEYGGTVGLVTLEDAIETLLGVEIVDEFDSVEDMRELARRLSRRRLAERLRLHRKNRTDKNHEPNPNRKTGREPS